MKIHCLQRLAMQQFIHSFSSYVKYWLILSLLIRKLLKDLSNKLMVKRELGMIAAGLSLKYGKYMAIASAALLTAKNVEVPLVNDKEIDSIYEETD